MLAVLVFHFLEYPSDLVQANRPLLAYQLVVTIVLEISASDPTFFDSTPGYSQDWIHKYLIQQQPFPSSSFSISIPASRPRTAPSFSFSSSTGRQRRSTATSFEERAKQKNTISICYWRLAERLATRSCGKGVDVS